MTNKQRYKAVIDGKEYTIVGQKPEEHLEAVVALINQQSDQLKELAPELSLVDRSVLMTINAVSDQMVKELRIMELEDQIKDLEVQARTRSSSAQSRQGKSRKKKN